MNEISNKWIGKNTVRPDGAEKVTGRAQYSSDTTMTGMKRGHVLRSTHPHAKIRTKNKIRILKLSRRITIIKPRKSRRTPIKTKINTASNWN